jgi:hypothetical protein
VKITISQQAAKFIGPSSPREVRLTAARGMLPLSPRDVIKSLYVLCHDKDDAVRGVAVDTLTGYSPKIIENLISGDLEPPIIDYLIRHHNQSHLFVDAALMNRNISDETLTFLASGGSVAILESIAENQERLLRSPGVLNSLWANPAVKGALRQRLAEFADPSARERAHDEGDAASRPGSADAEKTGSSPDTGTAPSTTSGEPDSSAAPQDEEELDERNVAARIGHMSVAEKIKYAARGNKETRAILLKDPSRLVVAAVIKSPKITEDEVLKVVQNKQANDEAIRLISLNKEWLKSYAVRLGLVYNPKTPTGIAVRLLQYLSKKDLKDVGASRNVPSTISAYAKKQLAAKEKSG